MNNQAHDSNQAMQRIKVGATGLAAVLLMIALASAVLSWASKDQPVAAVGASKPEVVANLTQANATDPAASTATREPLAELGLAPSVAPETPDNGAVAAQPHH
ncbi:MAG: hypothetical protein WC816_08545 [Sphingomonas sp.]|jgi:hypothetical protein